MVLIALKILTLLLAAFIIYELIMKNFLPEKAKRKEKTKEKQKMLHTAPPFYTPIGAFEQPTWPEVYEAMRIKAVASTYMMVGEKGYVIADDLRAGRFPLYVYIKSEYIEKEKWPIIEVEMTDAGLRCVPPSTHYLMTEWEKKNRNKLAKSKSIWMMAIGERGYVRQATVSDENARPLVVFEVPANHANDWLYIERIEDGYKLLGGGGVLSLNKDNIASAEIVDERIQEFLESTEILRSSTGRK